MKPDPDFGALPYCAGFLILCWLIMRFGPVFKAWRVRHWRATTGIVSDTMMVPHAVLVTRWHWRSGNPHQEPETQYIAVVSYSFNGRGGNRDGRLEQQFPTESAAHKFLSHFHAGQTVSVRISPLWPHHSTIDIDPAILSARQKK